MADIMRQEEMRELACCLIMDEDSDGVITVEEEVASVIRFMGDEIVVLMGDVEDDDGDYGSLQFQDFVDIISRKMKENVEEEVKEAFKVFDGDEDGFISAIELRNVMLNLGERLSDEEAEEMIKEADLDGDGRVSFEEFARIIHHP